MLFLKKQWFLIALAVALAIGFLLPEFVLKISETKGFRNSIVAAVLFLMALPLHASLLGQTLRRPLAPGLAILINSLLLPLFAWPCAWLLLNDDFGLGTLVAVAVPCTMASAAVWTRRAGGNYTAAIMVTVFTNFFCFLVTPFWVYVFTGKNAEISLSKMIINLAIVVVLPMTLGQLVRLVKGVGPWTTKNKTMLATLAQCGILIIVCTGAAETAKKAQVRHNDTELRTEVDSAEPVSAGEMIESPRTTLQTMPFLAMLFTVNFVHVTMLFLGIFAARLIGLSRGDQIAVGFAGSQKTLMVGLAVALDIGVSIMPMLAYHISQLFVDTLIADRIAKNNPATEQDT